MGRERKMVTPIYFLSYSLPLPSLSILFQFISVMFPNSVCLYICLPVHLSLCLCLRVCLSPFLFNNKLFIREQAFIFVAQQAFVSCGKIYKKKKKNWQKLSLLKTTKDFSSSSFINQHKSTLLYYCF